MEGSGHEPFGVLGQVGNAWVGAYVGFVVVYVLWIFFVEVA